MKNKSDFLDEQNLKLDNNKTEIQEEEARVYIKNAQIFAVLNFNSFNIVPIDIKGTKQELATLLINAAVSAPEIKELINKVILMLKAYKLNEEDYKKSFLPDAKKRLVEYQEELNKETVKTLEFAFYANEGYKNSRMKGNSSIKSALVHIKNLNNKTFRYFVAILLCAIDYSQLFRDVIDVVDIQLERFDNEEFEIHIDEDFDKKLDLMKSMLKILPPKGRIKLIKSLENKYRDEKGPHVDTCTCSSCKARRKFLKDILDEANEELNNKKH